MNFNHKILITKHLLYSTIYRFLKNYDIFIFLKFFITKKSLKIEKLNWLTNFNVL